MKRILMVLLGVVIVGFAGYWLGSRDRTAPVTTPHPGRPECPHDWDLKRGQMPAVGVISDIPEFHDCQRFIVYEDGEPRYDELYAIFAMFELADLADSLVRHAPPLVRVGRLVVIDPEIQLDTTDVETTAAETQDAERQAVTPISLPLAEIYAEGTYEPLGIQSRFSCLIVSRQADRLRARMVPVGNAEVDCREVRPDSGKVLKVNPVTVSVRDTAASVPILPPVARWDFDDQTRKQYIVITCGPTMWCEIGDQDLSPTAPPTVTQGVPVTRYAKGWYDQQYLATVNDRGETVPTRILGTIYPDPALDRLNDTIDFRHKWVPVAHVAFEVPQERTQVESRAAGDYRNNLNFAETAPNAKLDPDGDLNVIHFCYGTQGDCQVPARLPALQDCPQSRWWAMIENAGAQPDTVYRCVRYRGHPVGFHIPGTARWRWLASDETTWERCPQGCCEIPG